MFKVIEDMVLINTSKNAPQLLNYRDESLTSRVTTPVGTGLRSRFVAGS